MTFEEWVEVVNTQFVSDFKNGNCDVEWLFDGKVTICYDIVNNKVGIAKCHPDDENNCTIGKAIAYARCKGYKIPKQKVYKTFSEMKYGDKFKGFFGDTYIFLSKNPLTCNQYIFIKCNPFIDSQIISHVDFGDRYEMVD